MSVCRIIFSSEVFKKTGADPGISDRRGVRAVEKAGL